MHEAVAELRRQCNGSGHAPQKLPALLGTERARLSHIDYDDPGLLLRLNLLKAHS